jgi:hypothetical protein
VIGFNGVVCVVLSDVAGGGQQLVEHSRIRGSLVGAHLGRAWAVLENVTDHEFAAVQEYNDLVGGISDCFLRVPRSCTTRRVARSSLAAISYHIL